MNGVFFKANWAAMERETKHLLDAYRQLPPAIAKKHLRAAMRRSIKPFIPILRKETPRRTGNLRRSVKSVVRFYKSAEHGSVAGIVGFGRGGANQRKMGNHSAIVESGTKIRRKANGAVCGRMPARLMLQKSMAMNSRAILSNVSSELAFSLEKAARELANRQKR